jgi:hypothetical protein
MARVHHVHNKNFGVLKLSVFIPLDTANTVLRTLCLIVELYKDSKIRINNRKH